MSKNKAICQSGPTFLRERLSDRSALAPLTGQDSRALSAFFHLVELFGTSDGTGQSCAVVAMACCVCAMQPSTRYLAKAGIPHALDWADEGPLWERIENAGRNTADAVEIALVGGGR